VTALRDQTLECPDCGLMRRMVCWDNGAGDTPFVGLLCVDCKIISQPEDLLEDPRQVRLGAGQ
jgi:ssDNA-binding Zn-finger/Zn-ribbon topoisomerase 1